MLDHGVLNVPLAKRGDIDAQIDRYKAQQAKAKRQAERERAVQFKAQKAEAARLLAAHEQTIVQMFAVKFSAKQVRDLIRSWAKWEPAKLIALVDKAVEVSA